LAAVHKMGSLYLTVTLSVKFNRFQKNNFCTVAAENECENNAYIYLLIFNSLLLTTSSNGHCQLSTFTN